MIEGWVTLKGLEFYSIGTPAWVGYPNIGRTCSIRIVGSYTEALNTIASLPYEKIVKVTITFPNDTY